MVMMMMMMMITNNPVPYFSVSVCGNFFSTDSSKGPLINTLSEMMAIGFFLDLTCHWPCPPSQSPPTPVGVLLLKQLHTT